LRSEQSRVDEPAGSLDQSGAFWSTDEEKVQNRKIGNKITPELRIDRRFILIVDQLDP
jgi:hypothetical protein